MFNNLAVLAVLATAATSVLGHKELAWPYPLRSKLNPDVPMANKEWSMTAPLERSGQYPCKGFLNDPLADVSTPVATWLAGSTINYTVADGGATHEGGSCQVVLSYDNGQTWQVIYSHIGGCLIEGLTENIQIPQEAKSGKALFAWNWFNLVGNREMYQNCAVVNIEGGGSGLDPSQYPAPFVANVDAAPSCYTVEHTEVIFPNPGKNVKYGGKYTGTTPTEPAGFTGDCGTRTTTPGTGGSGQQPDPVSSSDPIPSPASSSSAVAASEAPVNPSTSSLTNNGYYATTSAAPAPTGTKAPKCKRRKRSIPSDSSPIKRHNSQLRRSPHQHLVRKKVSDQTRDIYARAERQVVDSL